MRRVVAVLVGRALAASWVSVSVGCVGARAAHLPAEFRAYAPRACRFRTPGADRFSQYPGAMCLGTRGSRNRLCDSTACG